MAIASPAWRLGPPGVEAAFAQEDDPGAVTDDQPVVPGPDDNDQQADVAEIEPLNPGEAVVTRFSHVVDDMDYKGQPIKVIDVNGTSASIIDIRRPGDPPSGQHWIDEPQRMFVTAGEVGQVFGIALAPQNGQAPDIFLSATAAFGLHRTMTGPASSDWMAGMWGPDAGPGTIYRISAANGYLAEKFTDVKLDGRDNTGASLGNIAYDQWHGRLFVSDLETGMIHSLDAETGQDMGYYDHGTDGRTDFQDAWSGKSMALDPVAFDPASSAQTETCSGDFAKTPSCWNIADFRRRVWGVKVRRDESGEVRLYYSVWGSDAFGNPDWAAAGDDRRNSVWSVAIDDKGLFDTASVRREFFMPAFWPADAAGDKAGNSNPVSDITFPECGPQNVMLVAERGGMRNLGLDKEEPFARPYESRVVRFEQGQDGVWRPKGRYDVGFHDRSVKEGDPAVFANAAGGMDFNYRLGDDGILDMSQPSQSVWMTGDGLCSPEGACVDKVKGVNSDTSEVHGLQGTPADAVVPIEPQSTPALDSLYQSYMIDTDINVDENGAPIAAELARNDATKIGDVAIYQVCQAPQLPIIDVPEEEILPPVEPPEEWPVHTLNQSHSKWASSGHRVRWSWHWRAGSWHNMNRSWHWREGSWHSANRSWHWRRGSWHDVRRSWHLKTRSFHARNRTWDDGHVRNRSFHVRGRTWDGGHIRNRSFHIKGRTWDGGHVRNRSFHVRGRTWDGGHVRNRSFHIKGRTWRDDGHVRNRSFHVRGRTWRDDAAPIHTRNRSFHIKGRTWRDDGTSGHVRNRSFHVKGRSWKDDGRPNHLRNRSFHVKGRTWDHAVVPVHTRKRSNAQQHVTPKHLRSESRRHDTTPVHTRKRSNAQQHVTPKHLRSESRRHDATPVHTRKRSNAQQHVTPQHLRSASRRHDATQQHSRRASRAVQNNRQQHLRNQGRQHNEGQHHNRRRSLLEMR